MFLLFALNFNNVYAIEIHQKSSDFQLLLGSNIFNVPKEEVFNWFIEDPYIIQSKNNVSEIENINLILNKNIPYELTGSVRDRYLKIKKSKFKINKEAVEIKVKEIASKVNSLPKNAELSLTQEGKILVSKPDKKGIVVDVLNSVKNVLNALEADKKSAVLEIEEKLADVRSDNIEKLGLKEVIAEGRSNFSGSTLSRIHNIKTAASKFKNLLIAPNEEFSFLDNLGPVDGEHGYKKELVIKDNQTIPEYGGGTCQVSTTIFRTAIFAGMKIKERKNHSYPVHYYLPIGFDATVYIPSPDLRFINNTDHYIMLDTFVEGHELVFRFYGTKDGRKVQMKGPVVTERNPDGSMKTYFTQKVFDASGNLIIDDTFYSNYKSPNDFPRPGEEKFTSKPDNWSKKQWREYKKKHGL